MELTELGRVEAVTFDFFNTLVFHREGRGRGRLLIEYLQAHGLRPTPWEHGVLYEIFEGHDTEYSSDAPEDKRDEYYALIAQRVFARLGVPASTEEASRHASSLWQILGPACFDVFPDALEALKILRAEGYPLAIISNWQCGLRHFCGELGLSEYFDHIRGSADLGVAKGGSQRGVGSRTRRTIGGSRRRHRRRSLKVVAATAKLSATIFVNGYSRYRREFREW